MQVFQFAVYFLQMIRMFNTHGSHTDCGLMPVNLLCYVSVVVT